MRPFVYERASNPGEAARFAESVAAAEHARVEYLAGGTTLVDLMKLDVLQPNVVIDINALQSAYGGIESDRRGLRLGALARMADVADHPQVKTKYPVIAQSLQLAASQQIRNMASLGGNVLQRTRCSYFRDVSYAPATSATREQAAPQCMGSIAAMRCWAPATAASQPIPATSRRLCSRSTRRWSSSVAAAAAPWRFRPCIGDPATRHTRKSICGRTN